MINEAISLVVLATDEWETSGTQLMCPKIGLQSWNADKTDVKIRGNDSMGHGKTWKKRCPT